MTADLRMVALVDYHIRGFEALLGAIDQLLAGPGPYFDPESLPDPQLPDDFCTRHQALRDGVARDVPEIGRLPLTTRKFKITRGPGFPVQGCLGREEMESMRLDVNTCIAVLRSV
jgi:hypothetical protein